MEIETNRQQLTKEELIISAPAVDLDYYRTIYKTPNANGYKQGVTKFNRMSLASERLLNVITGNRLVELAGGLGKKSIMPEGMREKAKMIICMLIDQQLNDDFLLNEARTSRDFSGGGISYSEAMNKFNSPYDMLFEGVRAQYRSSGLDEYLRALQIEQTNAGVIFNSDAYLKLEDYQDSKGTASQKDNSTIPEEIAGGTYIAPTEFQKDGTTRDTLEYLRFLIDANGSDDKVDGLIREDNTISTTLEPTIFKVNELGNIGLDPLIIDGVTFGDGSLVNSQNKAINIASDLPFEPTTFFTGNTIEDEKEVRVITSTNVQDAIEEVDSKIAIGDADTLAQANQYTDEKTSETLTQANQYTDEQIANIPEAIFSDGVIVSDVSWESKADLDYVDNQLAITNGNIDVIENTIEQNAIGELIAKGTGGVVNEGVWQPITFPTLEKNTFPSITLSGSAFTLTEDLSSLNVLIQGSTLNTNNSKTISLRLWDITTNSIVGTEQSVVIDSAGIATFQIPLNILAGQYRVEITSTVASGTITFSNYFVSLLKFGGGSGASVVKSSDVIDDVDTLPTTGLNTRINAIQGIAEGNTAAIELLETDKADKTYVDTELGNKADISELNINNEITITNFILNLEQEVRLFNLENTETPDQVEILEFDFNSDNEFITGNNTKTLTIKNNSEDIIIPISLLMQQEYSKDRKKGSITLGTGESESIVGALLSDTTSGTAGDILSIIIGIVDGSTAAPVIMNPLDTITLDYLTPLSLTKNIFSSSIVGNAKIVYIKVPIGLLPNFKAKGVLK